MKNQKQAMPQVAYLSTERHAERQAGNSKTEHKLPELSAKGGTKTENPSSKHLSHLGATNFERIQLRQSEPNMFASVRMSKSSAPVNRTVKNGGLTGSTHGAGSLMTTHMAGLK